MISHRVISAITWLFASALCGQLAASGLCFEAELANDITLPFEIVEKKGASGGLALGIPEGAGCGQIFRGDDDRAVYHIPIPEDGYLEMNINTDYFQPYLDLAVTGATIVSNKLDLVNNLADILLQF